MPKRLIAGNWKMNGLRQALSEAEAVATDIESNMPDCDVLICPPATLLSLMSSALKDSSVSVGGQDCHVNSSGPHTGDISAEMLADAGCQFGIVGHSERRTDHGETDALINGKAQALVRAGLTPIVCIGETREERVGGLTLNVLETQLRGSVPLTLNGKSFVVAYEPVWAIGTGLVPENVDIAEAHLHTRNVLKDMGIEEADEVRILYGGSVKPGNAAEILSIANVNGALVGGASLNATDFLGIIHA